MKKVSVNWVLSVVLGLFIFSGSGLADISLRLDYGDGDWQEVGPFAAFFPDLPKLGIYSDSDQEWSGKINGRLINGRLANSDDGVFYVTGSISELDPLGSGYRLSGNSHSSFSLNNGINFTMDFDSGEGIYIDHILLYDDSSIFNVPVDTLRVWNAGSPGYDDAELNANAGDGYLLLEGGSVTFNASASTVTYWEESWDPDYEPSSWTDNITSDFFKDIYWSINGVNVAYGLTPELSYDTLMQGLNLTPGTYDLKMEIDGMEGYDYDITTIEIIPEPISFAIMIGGGALMLKRRVR